MSAIHCLLASSTLALPSTTQTEFNWSLQGRWLWGKKKSQTTPHKGVLQVTRPLHTDLCTIAIRNEESYLWPWIASKFRFVMVKEIALMIKHTAFCKTMCGRQMKDQYVCVQRLPWTSGRNKSVVTVCVKFQRYLTSAYLKLLWSFNCTVDIWC